MLSLTKGQNAPLPMPQVVIAIDVATGADISALLVTESGKVRSDADFVFFNQPMGPGVQLQNGRLDISTAGVPADIAAIRAVITLDNASASFGQFAPPVTRVLDGAGALLFEYVVEGLTSESVVIAVEVYQKGGQWKVRAVGQGYAGGFADLVRDHGVSVDDAPAPTPAAPAPAPATPAPAAPPAASGPYPVPPVPSGSYSAPPLPPFSSAPTGGYPAPSGSYPAPPAPAGPSAPYPAPPAPSGPSGGFPAPGPYPVPPVPSGSYSAPPLPPFPSAPTGGYPAPPLPGGPVPGAPVPGAPAPEISLSKDRPISLVKGQKVSLCKDGGVALTQIQMGLGWDPVQSAKRGMFGGRGGGSIDLDASVLMFSAGNCVEVVSFKQLRSGNGAVVHFGDNLTGQGNGDDEVIAVDLTAIPPHVDNVVFIVTSFRGQQFTDVQNAYCRLIDQTTNGELARYTLAGGMPFTGACMAVISLEGGTWRLRAIGEGFNAKVAQQAIPLVSPYLA